MSINIVWLFTINAYAHIVESYRMFILQIHLMTAVFANANNFRLKVFLHATFCSAHKEVDA